MSQDVPPPGHPVPGRSTREGGPTPLGPRPVLASVATVLAAYLTLMWVGATGLWFRGAWRGMDGQEGVGLVMGWILMLLIGALCLLLVFACLFGTVFLFTGAEAAQILWLPCAFTWVLFGFQVINLLVQGELTVDRTTGIVLSMGLAAFLVIVLLRRPAMKAWLVRQ